MTFNLINKIFKTDFIKISSILLIAFTISSCDENFKIKNENYHHKEKSLLAKYDEEWERILSLKGKWKFSIGDDSAWAKQNFDDSKWDEIRVPSSWENEGFHGYDGYAWYRKNFYCPTNLYGKSLYVKLGYIDDVDQVYVNGHQIGSSGSFPPDYKTAYDAMRIYYIPEKYLNINGENTIAIRVYDSQLEGGMMWGEIGLYMENTIELDVKLEGEWKFKTGDSPDWKEANYNDSKWNKIIVPGFWENQGYPEYDGFARYRKSFEIPENLLTKNLTLIAGKIDDLDEIYFNGKLIGSTGEIKKDENGHIKLKNEWLNLRVYDIPKNLINPHGKNVISVKVYDGYINGGIYRGPVGIVEKEKLAEFLSK